MQFMQPPSIQSHTYPSFSGTQAFQSAPNLTYNAPIMFASAQYPAQYTMQVQEPTQVTSIVMESKQVTETIMVPQQITKTIQVPKQVTSTVNYGAQEAGSIQSHADLESKPQLPVRPAPAWLLREEEITCIYNEMEGQVHGMTLTCNRTSA